VWKIRSHCDAIADIGENSSAPIARNLINESLAITRRAARVGQERYITIARINLWIPTIAPVVVPSSLRSAMNQNDQRILLARIEISRFHNPAGHLCPERARPGDFFGWLKIEWRQERIISGRQCRHGRAIDITAIDFRRLRHAAAREDQSATITGEMNVAVDALANDCINRAAAGGNRIGG